MGHKLDDDEKKLVQNSLKFMSLNGIKDFVAT
jgi:hypothetical protein